MLIIDAHLHLWEKQAGVLEGKPVVGIGGGRSDFGGETRQMLPPYMKDDKNTAEILLSNMDYACVSGAVVTQEYIDGNQDDYLKKAKATYPERLKICSLYEEWKDEPQKDNSTNARDLNASSRVENIKESSITESSNKESSITESNKNEYNFKDSNKYLSNLTDGFDGVKICAGRLKNQDLTALAHVFKHVEQSKKFLSIDLADGDLQTASLREMIEYCPDLKVAIGHFGMVTRSGWKEQIKLARYKNVSIESGGITWLFNDEFYPYSGAVVAIKEAADICGVEKLMWGSDYPRTMTAITYQMSYDFILKSNGLESREKELFLGENAKEFYGFGFQEEMIRIKNMVE